MAEFQCDSCSYVKSLSDDLAGKRGKCPKCGGSGPIFPAVEAALVRSTSRQPQPQLNLQQRPTPKRRSTAKKAMIVASFAWPLIGLAMFAVFVVGGYSTGQHVGSNVYSSGYMYSQSEWLVLTMFGAMFWVLFFCVPMYFITIAICFVIHFVTNDATTGEH